MANEQSSIWQDSRKLARHTPKPKSRRRALLARDDESNMAKHNEELEMAEAARQQALLVAGIVGLLILVLWS